MMINLETIYKKLYTYFQSKFKREYLHNHKSDLRCSKCKIWYSVSTVSPNYDYDFDNTEFGWKVRCVTCGDYNYWNLDVSMFPVSCNEKGTPLKEGKDE